MVGKRRMMWALIVASAVPAPAWAQSLDDKYWIVAGGFLPDVDSKVEVSSASRPDVGTTIDLESDLALDDRKTLPQVSAGIRFSRHWSAGVEYYSLRRHGSVTLARDLTVDDVVYPLGAQVQSGFDSDVYRATVGYAFVRKPNTELGAAIGAHVTNFVFSIAGDAQAGGATLTGEVRRRTLLAPLPTIGLFGSQRIIPDVTLSARADYLSLKIGDYKGRLLNAQAALTWRFAKNFGVGAMYRYVDYRVDVEKPRWNGSVQYKFHGPAIFLEIGFR